MEATSKFLDQLLEDLTHALTPESARRLIDLRASDELQRHLDDLADRNTEGQLSEEEKSEYESLVAVGNVITILQAKVREMLSGHSAV